MLSFKAKMGLRCRPR